MTTLVDNELQALVNVQAPDLPLITPFDNNKLSNCRYDLRAGKAFLPKSGSELVIGSRRLGRRKYWSIKPSETLVIMTQESVNMPDNLFASYSQLNSLARQGLLLINASIVEPLYRGPLSCFLVNFSKETIHLYPGDAVAKMCFHRLSAAPQAPKPLTITAGEYERGLMRSAQLFPVSFMDIGGVEERVADRVTKGVNNSLKIAVVFLAVLAFWTTFEPLTSKFLWERIGVLSNTQRQEVMKLRQELETTKHELAKSSDDLKVAKMLRELEDKIKAQSEQIDSLKRAVSSQ